METWVGFEFESVLALFTGPLLSKYRYIGNGIMDFFVASLLFMTFKTIQIRNRQIIDVFQYAYGAEINSMEFIAVIWSMGIISLASDIDRYCVMVLKSSNSTEHSIVNSGGTYRWHSSSSIDFSGPPNRIGKSRISGYDKNLHLFSDMKYVYLSDGQSWNSFIERHS